MMRRWAAVAAMCFVSTAITLPAAGADITSDPTTTQLPAASTSTSQTLPSTTVEAASTTPPEPDPTPTAIPTTLPTNAPHPAAAVAAAGNSVVSIISNTTACTYFCFTPAQMTVKVGDTVTWTNQTTGAHTVARCATATCDGTGGGTGTDATFMTGPLAIAVGASTTHIFTQPGTYIYYCTLHGYALMHGTITVTAGVATTTATTTTNTTPDTTAVGTPAPTPSPPVDPTQPNLANTGARTTGMLTVALIAIVLGFTATSFRLRRRYS